VLDLDDLDVGSPLFDLRIAEGHRGSGVGRVAVTWSTNHLFSTYLELNRIEATTRDDNAAMQRVFERCRYRLEGRMLEAWKNADDTRSDTLIFAILGREWHGAPQLGGSPAR
jgi:RimJ/RimL family protein N-acetyltransferase